MKRLLEALGRDVRLLPFLLGGGTGIAIFWLAIWPKLSWMHGERFGIATNLAITLAAIISSLATRLFAARLRTKLRTAEDGHVSFAARLTDLTRSLRKASSEVDGVLQEMAEIGEDRHAAIEALEKQLADLSRRESELKDKIQVLEKVPLPAVDRFLEVTAKGERRSAFRDYGLFLAGVAFSLVLRLFGF